MKLTGQKANDGLGAWLPIETALKDGTWILLVGGECDDESDDKSRIVSGHWTNYLNGLTSDNYGRWQFSWYDGGYYGKYKNPTHWMPMLALPRSVRVERRVMCENTTCKNLGATPL